MRHYDEQGRPIRSPMNKPPPPPAPPWKRPQFFVRMISTFSVLKCQLCGTKSTFTDINAVGPFNICDECVAELNVSLGH